MSNICTDFQCSYRLSKDLAFRGYWVQTHSDAGVHKLPPVFWQAMIALKSKFATRYLILAYNCKYHYKKTYQLLKMKDA